MQEYRFWLTRLGAGILGVCGAVLCFTVFATFSFDAISHSLRGTTWLTTVPVTYIVREAQESSTRTITVSFFLGLLLATFVVFQIYRLFKRSRRLVLIHKGTGDVSIDLAQVSRLAQRETEEISGVREVRTEARVDKKGLFLEQLVAVEPQTPFSEIAMTIQDRVKVSLEHQLGLPVIRVGVRLQTFISKAVL